MDMHVKIEKTKKIAKKFVRYQEGANFTLTDKVSGVGERSQSSV